MNLESANGQSLWLRRILEDFADLKPEVAPEPIEMIVAGLRQMVKELQ